MFADLPRYEGMLRLFKERRRRAGENLIETPHYHGLIDEAEAEMHALSWPELMAAGGVAGVVAWVVSTDTGIRVRRGRSYQVESQ